MNKKQKKEIKLLKEQGKYDDIYVNYGQKAYKRNTPYNYRKKELKKLKREGKYEDIFNKYGENEYNKILVKAKAQEIKEAQGTYKAYLWEISQRIKMIMKHIGIYGATAIMSLPIGLSTLITSENIKNSFQYEREIEAYDENISEYAKEVKAMHLNDIQTIMKVTDDMWKNIKGYGVPEKEIIGYWELELATKDGYGECRNMANDVAKKLNKIDERYNARIMVVTTPTEEIEYNIANIERKKVETNETKENQQEENDLVMDEPNSTIGNHMIVLVDIPRKDTTLVLDPTNPSLGVYINGKIKMFNSDEEYGTNKLSTALLFGNEDVQTVRSFVDSYTNDSSYEELKREYGLEKQNEALEFVRNLELNKEASTKQKDYKETLKVETNPGINTVSNQEKSKNKINEDMQL